MARIADDVVERLKREVSLERLAESSGVVLKRHGDNLIGCCPFHADKTPSFVVTPSKSLWHCLGACQVGGTVIDFVMRRDGSTFFEACETLQRELGIAPATTAAPRSETKAQLEVLAAPEERDGVVLRRVVDFYHATLKQSTDALAYLRSRGLEHAELIETFKLGHANRTLCERLPSKQVKAGAALRGQLQRLGVYRDTGREHFYGCVTIPLFNTQGEVVQMYGRRIGASEVKHLYMRGPHRGVFNLPAFSASKDIVLCEALIDALTFWCAGYRNVTSAYGVEGFTPELREALSTPGIERVLIAYDADDAGSRAAEKLAPELSALGLSVFRVNFPRRMDANEYAQKLKPAERSLGTALRAAHWMAGGRPVMVPIEVTKAHAKNRVAADTNAGGIAPTREAVQPEEAGAVRSEVVLIESAAPTMRSDAETSNARPAEPVAPVVARDMEDEPAPVVEVTAKYEPDEPTPLPSLAAALDAKPEPKVVASETLAGASPAQPVAGPPLPAPVPPSAVLQAEVSEEQVVIRLGDRRWRIRGLGKNLSPTQLKVNVLVDRGAAFFVDQVELNSARHRAAFLAQAAKELETEERVLKRDLGLVFQKLEELQDQAIQKALEPKGKVTPEMSEAERDEALALLKDPRLLDRILADFDRAGVVGEHTNKLVGYLATVSRKLAAPLGVVIQSTSAAGKSSLMDAVLSFVPEEERVQYSAMTGQSLYYMGEGDLQHKILAIAEEEGASNASYALKLLQSEGELTIASTGKNPADGRLVTQEYRVTGPVMVMMTTTAIHLDEELMNRCIVLTVDDGREQTRAIHERQREAQTIEGILSRQDRGAVMQLHQNAQRLLKPMTVANPFAKELRFADHATRTRRDHAKYLTLINTITLLHQHQRPVKEMDHRGGKVRYIEATRADIAVADRLASQVLARSMDELSPQTRGLLQVIDALVTRRAQREGVDRSDVRFTQREVRERGVVGATQVKMHLQALVSLEYVVRHRAGHAQRNLYELSCSAVATAPDPFEPGGHEYDPNRSAKLANRSANSADRSATGRGSNRPVLPNGFQVLEQPVGACGGHDSGTAEPGASYVDIGSYSQASEPTAAE